VDAAGFALILHESMALAAIVDAIELHRLGTNWKKFGFFDHGRGFRSKTAARHSFQTEPEAKSRPAAL
jgi:hypothetical protein